MKFGETLKSSLIQDYNYYYIQYDELKYQLKKGVSNGDGWDNELEEQFVSLLETELDKVYSFVSLKHQEILRRISDIETLVYDVINANNLLNSNGNNHENNNAEEDFEELEKELSDIIADVHDLAKFSRLNYIGFQKILKKHDKQTKQHYILRPIFQARLQAKAFYKDNYDALIVQLSRLYDLVRTRGNPVKGDSSAGGSQQNFVRQTTKYWVHPDNITELKLVILKHLPVLVFNASKEFEKDDSAITSIYYDNSKMDLYYGRLLKDEGAELIRLRWYGGMSSETIFAERKTHREDWTGEKSVKLRFALKERNVNEFMRGKLTLKQVFEKMRREKKKSVLEIDNLERLANEVQYRVLKDKMRPVMRSFYNRTAFQLPGDARVRISLDTELTMVREDNFDGHDRTHNNWRRMDIGVDYPFSQLPEKDVCRFPYAVLEVKLQTQLGQEPPLWVKKLVSSHLVEAVPKFSKFIHGCATLLPEKVDLIPFWLPQMDVDIRKPKYDQEYGIVRQQPLQNGIISNYNSIDEEEFIGGNLDIQESQQVQFSSNTINNELTDDNTNPSTLIEYIKTLFKPDHSFNKVPQGTVFDTVIRLPPGKKISVPVRVEPKVYFATERTFLTWTTILMTVGSMGTLLLNYGSSKINVLSSVGFFLSGILIMFYSMAVYLWRVVSIRHKRAIRYDEYYGVNGVCVLLVLTVLSSFLIHWLE